jgi:DnaK suppressor protein
MRTETIATGNQSRRDTLRDMLTRLRDETYERIAEFRRDQRDSASPTGDEMDIARSAADVETHASLIERAEDRLRYIDAALSRLERGVYGTCAECGEAIPLERLVALPFAIYCVDCQQNRIGPRHRWGSGGMIPAHDQRWTPPADMDEVDTRAVGHGGVDDDIPLMSGFGPEEPEVEGEGPAEPRRRRGRPRKQ